MLLAVLWLKSFQVFDSDDQTLKHITDPVFKNGVGTGLGYPKMVLKCDQVQTGSAAVAYLGWQWHTGKTFQRERNFHLISNLKRHGRTEYDKPTVRN